MRTNSTFASRFIFARVIGSAYFWGSISIPYLVFRGFTISEAFTLIGLYSFLVVILEFPTGVIGDYFGHKLSVNLANVLGAVSFLIVTLPLPHYGYYLLIILAAISSALVSGSDVAYLHSLSRDFKKDLASLRTYSTVVAFISLSSAGYLATISLTLPLFLMAGSWLVSALLIYFLPNLKPSQLNKGNVYEQASRSVKVVLASTPILGVILYTMVNNGFEISVKTVINSFGANLGFGLTQVSLIVGLSFLARALGLKLSPMLQNIRTRYLFLGISLSMLILTLVSASYLSLILLSLSNFIVAVITLRADYVINDLIPDHLRASILSLRNLLVRLFSAIYLIFAGQLISHQLFQYLMLATLIIYVITGFIFLKITTGKDAKATIPPTSSRQTPE